MTKDFQAFWTFLETNNPQWWDFTKMRFFSKDLKKCAQDCYAYLLADQDAFSKMEPGGIRKYFVAWLMKAPDAPVKPQLQQESEPFKESENFLVGEERAAKIKWAVEQILANPVGKPVPKLSHKAIAEEGQWVPKSDRVTRTKEDMIQSALTHMETVRTAKEKEYRKVNPKATDDEVNEYLDSLEFEF